MTNVKRLFQTGMVSWSVWVLNMSLPLHTSLQQEIPHRKIPPQNVVLRLRERETFSARPGSHFHVARRFYNNVFPNFTVTNVEKPPCYLRKFSPSGRYFIAFSLDQTALEIYEFKGSDAAGDMLQGAKTEHVLTATGNERFVNDIRLHLFNKFFTKKSSTILAHSGEQLNRECSLFTCDGKYVIVGAAKDLNEARHPLTSSIFRNNEAVTGFRTHVETYTLSVVELATGRVTDSKVFLHDKIFLSHNQGIYLYKSTLAVLCVQQQSIHIFQVCCARFITGTYNVACSSILLTGLLSYALLLSCPVTFVLYSCVESFVIKTDNRIISVW